MRVGRLGAGLVAVVLATSLFQVPGLAGAPRALADPAAPVPEGQVSEQDAVVEARRSGQPVEVLSQRGEHRTVRALPSGRLEVTEHLRPIRTRQDGRWVDIDTTLRSSGAQIVPGATAVGLRLSAGGDGPLVRMSKAGRELSLTWPQALPAPVLEGDTAVYRGVLGPDVDLRVRVEPEGFAHTFVVKTAEAAQDPRLAKLAFGLGASRLSVAEGADGVLQAKDASSGAAVFEAPAPVMWDSTQPEGAQARTGTQADADEGPAEGAKTAPVQVSVAGGQLALTPDQGLLTSPDTAFPVFIDPVWQTSAAYAWGMVSSGYPDQTYYKFAGKSTEGMGRCLVSVDPTCVKDQTKRLFYRMKLPAIKGNYIQSAEFVAYETHAYDCDNGSTVELWRASALSSGATWNNTASNWDTLLTYRDVAHCSRAPVEFGGATLRTHVQSAVNKGYSTITFGLKAYRETTMSWWKRFADDAYLRVQYNRPPLQPDNDEMVSAPGTPCVPRAQAQPVNQPPVLRAVLRDPDTEDANKVQGRFELHWANNPDGSDWGPKWTAPLTAPKTSGTPFEVNLKTLGVTLPVKTVMGWGVTAWDGEQWGPASWAGAGIGCYFTYDPAVPAAPTVTSAAYPADSAWHGGVGEAGTFTISDSAHVAVRYDLTLNGRELPSVTTTAGAARQVQVVPDQSGSNKLMVKAFTSAGQNTESTTYEFRVNAGADPVARFTLDEDAGDTTVQARTPGTAVIGRGGATLGGAGRVGTGLTLNGTDAYAETNLPVIDTSQSFTVSAWVRLDAQDPERYYTVLSQAGDQNSAFFLRYDVGSRQWVFGRPNTDGNVVGWSAAWSAEPAVFGQWTHLVGVYDQAAAKLRLYVNGVPGVESGPVQSAWKATGAFQIGLGKWMGWPVDYLPGVIDEVKVFQRALSDSDASDLAEDTNPSGDGPKAHWALDEDAGARRAYSPTVPITAAVQAGVTLGVQGQDGTAMRMDGTGTAGTSGPLINTTKSFAVAAWVRLDSADDSRHATVLSQDGTRRSGFILKYDPTTKKWMFGRAQADTDSADGYRAYSARPAALNSWTHLVGVYDAVAQRTRLYVNGESGAESQPVQNVWHADGGFQIGQDKVLGSYVNRWPGLIDDVRVYDRVVGPTEAEELVAQHPALKGRWKFNADGAGEPAGAPAMTLAGGAVVPHPDAGFNLFPGAGMMLNGTTAYAETSAPPLRTDDSFTVAGWVNVAYRPEDPVTVFSQAGTNANAFALRYVPDTAEPAEVGNWQLEMRNGDSATAALRVARHPEMNPGDWHHVAVVYDALRDHMSLYVNGNPHKTFDGVSEEDQVLGFAASNGGLQIGRSKLGAAGGSEFWPEAIDDVWAYQGALNIAQIQQLAFSQELETGDGP